jgi:CheY-like chemotaxis protein
MNNVLLVFSRQQQQEREFLYNGLEDAGLNVNYATDRKKAISRMEHDPPYAAIICSVALAGDASSPREAYGGIELCQQLRAITRAPIFVIAPAIDNDLQTRCRAVAEPAPIAYTFDEKLVQTLSAQIRALRPPPRRLDVIIDAADGADWKYELVATGFKFQPKTGVLRMGNALLLSHRALSDVLPQMLATKGWYGYFCKLGMSLIQGLCETNASFRGQLLDGIEQAGGLENTRVTFCVGRETYQIALEAIFRPKTGPIPG